MRNRKEIVFFMSLMFLLSKIRNSVRRRVTPANLAL